MNRVISWLRNIRISQILVVFLVGFMFLLGQAFSYVDVAQADVTTPEGTYYKGVPDGKGEIRNDTTTQIKNTQNPIKGAVDNIREKLNLDEKPPEATKEFLKSATNKVEETVEPVTGEKQGYYHNSPKK
ncbi:hypothetical protein CDG76_20575 [Nostoc sp. 'Peltigera membranacea cyanobiont' 210A]|uniref:hypothetical protein n=1 Tax=Nostoc sp. 'Peltigera membranacea cyanobiont' 210A TaxID=2014529 RepID=UPI000B95BD5B|nr:hypothetical protein [Nostoc sp. 'Peltigera membranacea cyanobiont' 210A]OYD93096.1 hypothetical protein CDG76_20575 [Nostoc sp. 'Peltigera membranacea cyanobiont' 210A]